MFCTGNQVSTGPRFHGYGSLLPKNCCRIISNRNEVRLKLETPQYRRVKSVCEIRQNVRHETILNARLQKTICFQRPSSNTIVTRLLVERKLKYSHTRRGRTI